VDPSIMQAADVIVYGRETLRGVVVSTPPHLRPKDEEGKLPAVDEMMVDVGYDLPAEKLEKIVPVGTPIGFAPYYTELSGGKEGEKCLSGKSFDNKACGAAAAYAIATTPREALAADVCLLLSSYEETNRLGGVSAAIWRTRPICAMVVDVNLARVPDTKKFETVPFGKGVSISVSAATDRALTKATRALCDQHDIPYSMIAAPSSTGTNAATVNLVGAGVPVVDVGLPLKNMHTYEEILCEQDVRALCDLVRAFVTDGALVKQFSEDKEVRIRVRRGPAIFR
jgi:endoglucanase